MKCLTVLLILIHSFGFTQDSTKVLTIKYDYHDSLLNDTFESFLKIDKDSSVYYVKQNLDYSEESSISNGSIMLGGVDDKYIFKNTTSKRLESFESYDGKDYFMVKERLPELKWILSNTFKSIENYKCQKAITHFRGRDYIAWFTLEIPTSHGPWKFNGLPGLIMQISDKGNYFVWSVKEIKTNLSVKIPTINEVTRDIDLKKYHDLVDENMKKLRARVLSKLPKGTVATIPKKKRLGVEVIYEWETEDEEKK